MTRPSTPVADTPPSVVILGSDALLAALPATPTQLMNACYAAGFEGVFPASWGDELVAAGCLKNLETRIGPAILCACPLVSEQLRGVAPLQRFQLHLVSPPVAAARYLRALCDDSPLRVTYVGDCPGADDPAIDERVSPAEFLRRLFNRGIAPSAQRPDLGANAPRDRRRFYSLPGGAPTQEWLSADWPKRTLVDVDAGDALADLAHHALARESTLIDFAPQLGCACSGAVGGVAPAEARKAVAALEPPRARQEVLDPGLRVPVEGRVPLAPSGVEVSWDEFLASLPRALAADPEPEVPEATAPTTTTEVTEEPSPRRSREGTSLPRSSSGARAARRRSSGVEIGNEATVAMDAVRAAESHAPPPPVASSAVPVISTATAAPLPAATATAAGASGGTGSASIVRASHAVPRRGGSGDGGSGPRYASPPRAVLSAPDRWMLFALMLGGSVLSAAFTSYLTIRALAGRGATATAPDSAAVHASAGSASVKPEAVPPPAPVPVVLTPTPPPLGDQRALAPSAARTPPAAPAKAATVVGAGAGKPRKPGGRAAAVVPPNVARATPPTAVPAATPNDSGRTASTIAPAAAAAGGAAAAATDGSASPASAAAPPAAVPGAVPENSPPAATPRDSSSPTATPAAAAAPVPPPPPAVDIAAELKAIREELARRSKRVDSLNAALDSMKTPPKPRPPQ